MAVLEDGMLGFTKKHLNKLNNGKGNLKDAQVVSNVSEHSGG
jgi:hypothetical protein